MTHNKRIKLGIFVFGCVGQGVYHVLNQTKGIKADIVKICVKDSKKERILDSSFFTTKPADLLDNPEIDVIVELIDDAEAAFKIVSYALKKGKAVVTANKKMIAEHSEELYSLQQTYQVPLLYEAAACASIPIIRNLEEYYDNDLLTCIEGILNGSTNYILTGLTERTTPDFNTALKEAQLNGFAESDPTLDIEGFDPRYKLSILILHAFGIFTNPASLFTFGISRISTFDLEFARQRNLTIRLIARAKKENSQVTAFCMPSFIPSNHHLAAVRNEYNGVLVESLFSEIQFFAGKGAGSNPTGSAVVSDISALSYDYRYEYKKLKQQSASQLNEQSLLNLYIRFDDWSVVDMSVFETIAERFSSKKNHYIIGEITLQNLRKADWIKNPSVNIIHFPKY